MANLLVLRTGGAGAFRVEGLVATRCHYVEGSIARTEICIHIARSVNDVGDEKPFARRVVVVLEEDHVAAIGNAAQAAPHGDRKPCQVFAVISEA